ncbi:hypothetical protein [Yersinia phage vB_YenP_ISAO8]|uniref:Uncharacterized protein n=1 Tax=Yersinia phage vB_YenP_ISAO8 TaxID=1675027 RepID=A0A0H4TJY2_9CAUD|nr:hypothetical protein AVU16_gp21 [Yersinia phage vB_YenP_ISAO8]AKQ07687.1 hypothetical protein [Yersinia phage vB_YenP_ISAO8]
MTIIAISGDVYATSTTTLGEHIASGELKQVGVIRTEYAVKQGDTEFIRGRSTEAVVQDDLGDFFAVEQHRGLAIVARVVDEDMRQAFAEFLKRDDIEEGEVFVYDQRINEGQEMIEGAHGLDMSHIPVEDGTDGIA